MPSIRWPAVALATVTLALDVSAQDVEMLGLRYGTRPPDAYFREMARDPDAFQFTRGRAARMRSQTVEPGIGTLGAGTAAALGPRDGPVEGDVRIPVLLGLFFDSPATPPAFGATQVAAAYFTNPSGTVSAYYDEVSGGRVNLTGDVRNWVRSDLTRTQVAQGESALLCCGIGDFIKDLIRAQVGVDWGAFDNDGPDGVPNSGDDDGFVDALALMHPTKGAECDGNPDVIWSHKWSLRAASTNRQPFVTSTPSASGGFVRVDDYFIQGVLACDEARLNEIGVFTHEAGHAFGLPDLYDTRQSGQRHAGAGSWELMAAGTWGCDNNDPSRPCHMGAWSKAMLGWVDVITLTPDTDHGTLTLPPVLTSGQVLRVNAQDGSGEYFLLENRQDLGPGTFDRNLYAEGMLVWHIDPGWVASRWPTNAVNASSRMGVWLRQADGLNDLGTPGRGRGDSGDPFPGASANRDFHAGSNPAARSHRGAAAGAALLGITQIGDDVRFRAVTGFGILAVGPLDVPLTATVVQSVQLDAQNATAPVVWRQTGGVLPEGLALGANGRVTGAALELGTFGLEVEATDAVGLTAVATVTLQVGPPTIPIGQLASPFLLRGAPLSSIQETFLDRLGNGNGAYDLGDFRAWVLSNPSLPLSADVARLVGVR
jgi:M6 family metalloprotease-like protein